MSTLSHQPPQPDADVPRQPGHFDTLCAKLEEYEHLPELMPGTRTTRLITEQSHEDTIDQSILAGLTHP